MRVVADSHAIVWYGHDSPRLSDRARETLDEAVASDGVIMPIVTLVELWYVTKTSRGVNQEELDAIREEVPSSPTTVFSPVDEAVAGKFITVDRDLLRDQWDRFIVATALPLDLPLVTADRRIHKSGFVGTMLAPRHGFSSTRPGTDAAELVAAMEEGRTYFDLADFEAEAERLLCHRVNATSVGAPGAHPRELWGPLRLVDAPEEPAAQLRSPDELFTQR